MTGWHCIGVVSVHVSLDVIMTAFEVTEVALGILSGSVISHPIIYL